MAGKNPSNLTHADRVKGGKASRAKYAYGRADTIAKKLDLAVKQSLSKLVEDVQDYHLIDKGEIKDRKEYITLINAELQMINRMRDAAELQREEASKELTADITENKANVQLIKDANKKLHEAGMSNKRMTILQ